jgi:hypothetical protein
VALAELTLERARRRVELGEDVVIILDSITRLARAYNSTEKGTGRIVGCQIVGPHAVEIVHEVCVAMTAGMNVGELAHTTPAHPTVSEVIKMAASGAAAKC